MPDSTPRPWYKNPRTVVNVTLSVLASVGGVAVEIAAPGASWAGWVLAGCAGLLLGLNTPGSPVDALLDALVGPDDATARRSAEAVSAIREAFQRAHVRGGERPLPVAIPDLPARRPRREEGSIGLDLLGLIVCAALLALFLAGAGV